MKLIITITDNEELLYELLTGWIDIGITESTVLDSMDSLQVVSEHVPIFAGFKALAGGGIRKNKTIIAMVEEEEILNQAIHFLKKLYFLKINPKSTP